MSETAWNVRADQPYATETQATADLSNPDRKSYMALPLLMAAQAQHHMDNMNYADQVGQQRDYAYAALAARAQQEQQKNAIEGLKNTNPGALSILSNNPTTAGLYRGLDPNAANTFTDFATRDAVSKVLEATGKGAQGLLYGGLQLSPADASAATGANIGVGENPLVTQARIRAASSGATRGPTSTVTSFVGPNQITTKNIPPGQESKYMHNPGYNTGLPSKSDAPNIGQPVPSLPLAQTDTPANAPSAPASSGPAPPPQLVPVDNATRAQVQQTISQNVGRINGPAAADIQGSHDIRRDPSGQTWVIGKSGKPYRVNQ